MATSTKKPASTGAPGSKSYTGPNKDLNTQMPLSEKDEVKKAEERMNKSVKKSAK